MTADTNFEPAKVASEANMSQSREARPLTSKLKSLAFRRIVQSEKRAQEHWVASVSWEIVHGSSTTAAAVFSGAAGASIFADAQGAWRVTAGILALLASGAAAVATTLNGSQRAEDHKRGFDASTEMATKWLQYRLACEFGETGDDLLARFTRLEVEHDELLKTVPLPGFWAKRTLRRRAEKSAKRRANEQDERIALRGRT